jgi:formyltetrahydrofolate deformylase
MATNSLDSRILLIRCSDRAGLIHAITGLLLERGCNIISNHEFVEPNDSIFFMRTEFLGDISKEELSSAL